MDPALVAAASADHPGPTWRQADLARLDLRALGESEPFDGAVLAGNVMPFLAPGTEVEVLAALATAVRADGVIAVGFGLDRDYPLAAFDADVAAAGLHVEHRFGTWDLRRFTAAADFAVTVLRRP